MLAMTSNYLAQVGNARRYLRRIAEAGFSHVHWAHEWSTDYLYSPADLDRIAGWLDEFGLALGHVHASEGDRSDWMSADEARRRAGIELLANRIAMAERLGGNVVIVHLRRVGPTETAERDTYWSAVWTSLDELRAPARTHGVRLALENGPENFDDVEQVLPRYDEAYLGLCYDTGHGNIAPDGLDRLEALGARLLSVHVQDNNGRDDVHWLPFAGTVDWERFARILAASGYRGVLNVESILHPPGSLAEEVFLARACEGGRKILEMIRAHRE